MKRIVLRAVCACAALAVAPAAANAATFYTANFQPLNGSGVTGRTLLTLSDDASTLTVRIRASGLTPDEVHLGHIHGLIGSNGEPINSTIPTLAQDTDGDGFIEVAEGAATYGPIILPFDNIVTPDGRVDVTQTFNLLDNSIYADNFTRQSLLGSDLDQLGLREIVLHGRFLAPGPGAGTPGEVNGQNGYLAALPVTAGEIMLGGDANAIPEPATWAMMIGGFGMIGAAARRRNQTKVTFA